MHESRVLLLNPKYTNMQFGPTHPTGLGYLSQMLENNGIPLRIVDLSLGYPENFLADTIEDFQSNILGISLLTHQYRNSYDLITRLKRDYPGITVVVGGPYVTLIGGKVLEECRSADIGVMGDGENTLIELCKTRDFERVKGIFYRDRSGKVTFTGPRCYPDTLDDYPFPKYSHFDLKKYPAERPFPVITSRGCNRHCIYCCCRLLNQFRARSAQHVYAELKYWHDKGVRYFTINDDNPTLDMARIETLCQRLQRDPLENISILLNQVRADTVNHDFLKRMKDVGFNEIAFGVESGNDLILKSLGGGKTVAQLEAAISNACSLEFLVKLYFLIGSPGETFDRFLDSVALARKYLVDVVLFFNLVPYPNTPLFTWVHRNARFIRQPEEYLNCSDEMGFLWRDNPIFETSDFPLVKRLKAMDITRSVEEDINWKRKTKGNPDATNEKFYASL